MTNAGTLVHVDKLTRRYGEHVAVREVSFQVARGEMFGLIGPDGAGKASTRLADRLSGGMKQKLALACTLIHTPELLVLDEPTTGVDPVSRRDFWKILARLQREGLTLLLTTPYLDEAERCQRVALMDHGEILTVDTPDALRAAAGGLVLELIAHPKRRAVEVLQKRAGAADVQTFGERLHVTLPEVDPAQAEAVRQGLAAELTAAGISVEAVRAITPSLEDVFIARMRQPEVMS